MFAMEEALVLVILSPSFEYDFIPKIQKIPGVQEVHLIYSAYDMFVTLKTEHMKDIRSAVLSLRDIPGIQSTLTCNVINE